MPMVVVVEPSLLSVFVRYVDLAIADGVKTSQYPELLDCGSISCLKRSYNASKSPAMIIDSKEKSAESLPPNYDAVVKGQQTAGSHPENSTIYTFTGWFQDSMYLMPPTGSANQQPLYRISVELDLNPFLPVSYVTKIVRCGVSPAENLVAEFAIALNNKRAVLRMGDTATRLSNVLYSVNSSPKHFNWILAHRLHWDCRKILEDGSPMCICYLPPVKNNQSSSTSQSIQIAVFVPPPPDRSPPHPDATLTVFPLGHQIMDEIIVSALVVERMLTR